MARYENGESSYTYCENNCLLACVWLAKEEEANTAHSLQLHSFYCHPQLGTAKRQAFLATVTAAVTGEEKGDKLFAVASVKEKVYCETLEAIGFQTL